MHLSLGFALGIMPRGQPKHFCVQPTPEGPCGQRAAAHGRCREHGGDYRRRCLHWTPDGPCQTWAVGGGEVRACKKHGGGKRQHCLHPTPNGPCQTWVVDGSDVQACIKHGGGKRCLQPTPRGGVCQKLALCGGKVRKCVEHGGGVRCGSQACAVMESPPWAKFRSPEGQPLCWSCLAAQYPDRAKLKVRKEHLMLAELQRRLPWLGERATELIWDCTVPGGCTLKRPDMLFRLEDRFVQVEIDEEGHEDRNCADEDSRLELIAADVGLPGLVLRLNPDAERVLKRRRLSNGEHCFCVGDADAFNGLFDAAEAAVEAFVNEPAPESVRVLGLPASWWDGR